MHCAIFSIIFKYSLKKHIYALCTYIYIYMIYIYICALRDFLLDRNLPNIVVNGIHNMTELVLKKNVFSSAEC